MTTFTSRIGLMAALAVTLGLGACNTPGDRALGGAGIGGLAGAGIGGLAGGGRGALIGGLAGAATGAVVGASTAPQPAYGQGYYGAPRPGPAYSAGPVVYRGPADGGPYYEDYGYAQTPRYRPYAIEERRYYGGY